MTDGCAAISVGAALLICEKLPLGSRPSAFQGRINGAKGMWYISADYATTNQEHLDVWIEIRKSQVKVQFRREDLHPVLCEPDRWSFDVVTHSRPPRTSVVHHDFMQILEDCGVPRAVLKDMAGERLDIHIQELMTAIDDPAALTLWRCQYFRQSENPKAPSREFPSVPASKTKLLVEEAGYMPKQSQMLADAVKLLADDRLSLIHSQLRVACLESTTLIGIADPTGTLAPGEVHLLLSQPLEDEATERQCVSLAGRDILIARHPTLRGSDMERVRCVNSAKLSHIEDVVVMSTRGRIPLAGML
jgi:hypothetical protein